MRVNIEDRKRVEVAERGKVKSPAPSPAPEEEIPDGLMGELHLVMKRVDKVTEQFDGSLHEPKFRSRTADDPPANPKELIANINNLFEKQQNFGSVRTSA